jgi:hypothetical protein
LASVVAGEALDFAQLVDSKRPTLPMFEGSPLHVRRAVENTVNMSEVGQNLVQIADSEAHLSDGAQAFEAHLSDIGPEMKEAEC